jgi:hypothetical protein
MNGLIERMDALIASRNAFLEGTKGVLSQTDGSPSDSDRLFEESGPVLHAKRAAIRAARPVARAENVFAAWRTVFLTSRGPLVRRRAPSLPSGTPLLALTSARHTRTAARLCSAMRRDRRLRAVERPRIARIANPRARITHRQPPLTVRIELLRFTKPVLRAKSMVGPRTRTAAALSLSPAPW